MTASRGDQIVDGYLAQLDVALGDLPDAQRARIVSDIRYRIARARASMAGESDDDLFRLLDQIGDPAAAAARARAGLPPAPRTGWTEVLALAGLVLVWPAGVVLLWFSRVWSSRAKLVGSLAPPGGYAVPLIAIGPGLVHPGAPCEYDANGQLLHQSPGCPQTVTAVTPADAVLTSVLLVVIFLWLVLPVVSAAYLGSRAWRSIDPEGTAPAPASGGARPSRDTRLRLGVILAVATGPVVLLLILSAAFLVPLVRSAGEQQVVPSVPPSPAVASRPPPFPNLTPSGFASAFSAMAFSCDEPVHLGAMWATSCRETTGSVVAFGPDDHSIDVVMATVAPGGQAATSEQAGRLFDQVVRAVCPPSDANRISAWAHDHMAGGGQTDIDGYDVTLVDFAGVSSMSMFRSRP